MSSEDRSEIQRIIDHQRHVKFPIEMVLDRNREVTDKISTQTRTVSIGLILFAWGAFTATPNTKLFAIASQLLGLIGLVGFVGVLALLCDYLQYIFAKWVVDRTLNDEENKRVRKFKFPTQEAVYKAQTYCFWGKQIICLSGVGLLLVTFLFGVIVSS